MRRAASRGAGGLAALLLLGPVVAVTPYAARVVGLVVDVPARLEVIDHVVPGLAVTVAALVGLASRGRELREALAAAVGLLGGIWVTSTHVPLLAQAAGGLVTWPAALFHTVPGLVLLAVAAGTLLPRLWRRG